MLTNVDHMSVAALLLSVVPLIRSPPDAYTPLRDYHTTGTVRHHSYEMKKALRETQTLRAPWL